LSLVTRIIGTSPCVGRVHIDENPGKFTEVIHVTNT